MFDQLLDACRVGDAAKVKQILASKPDKEIIDTEDDEWVKETIPYHDIAMMRVVWCSVDIPLSWWHQKRAMLPLWRCC